MTIRRAFQNAFPDERPCFLVEAPGRVNLIGEHTDYNGYPVMPLALTRAIRILLSPRDDAEIVLVSGYGRQGFTLAPEIVPSPAGDWINYVKAACQGLIQHFGEGTFRRGFHGALQGDVPSGAGLSSSSALVVASALALLAANEREMPPAELADLMADAERYVGTAGGGMDQAVCLNAVEGHALRIGFFPLTARPVRMPGQAAVVIANSMVAAEKSGAARLRYNRRPLECRLATKLIAAALEKRTGRELTAVARLAGINPKTVGMSAEDLQSTILDGILRDGPYTTAEIAWLLGTDVAAIQETALTLPDGAVFPEPEDGFRLKQRVRHVLTEAARVDAAADALEEGDVAAIGELMNQSHASCRDDYGISTPELDALVDIMRGAGALGARLTGAGFGGCAVALVHATDEAPFIEAVSRRYHVDYLGLSEGPPEDAVFATKAGPGAGVHKV